MGEESPVLQSKPLPQPSFPPLADQPLWGKVLDMSDDDYTPDDGGDPANNHGHGEDGDRDHEAGSFYEEQYIWDKNADDARRGSCLLVLFALPAAGLLALLW